MRVGMSVERSGNPHHKQGRRNLMICVHKKQDCCSGVLE